jgi:hypothetical protein
MTQFLQLVNLSYEDYVLANRSAIRSDILFSNELPTSYVLTTKMFTVQRYGEQIQTFCLSAMSMCLRHISLLVLLKVAEV